MKSFKRICINDYTVTDKIGQIASVERGREYITSREWDDQSVTVFTKYWFRVPVRYFAGEKDFTQ